MRHPMVYAVFPKVS